MKNTSAGPMRGHEVVAFVAAADLSRAKGFYRDTLGLRLVSEDSFGLVFDVEGTQLRVSRVRKVARAEYTVLGWEVANLPAVAKALPRAGVALERYPGMQQDELGIWIAPGGTGVAWFKDPDGNILRLLNQ